MIPPVPKSYSTDSSLLFALVEKQPQSRSAGRDQVPTPSSCTTNRSIEVRSIDCLYAYL